jgi:hypothetical protein
MRQLLIAGVFVFCGIAVGADSVVIPLVDPSDPILITSARLEFDADDRPVMIISLENQTGGVINTNEIWLNTLRFYTKGEMARAERKMLWDCGLGSWAAYDGRESRPIAPKERIELRLPFTSNCQHNRDHEHFSLEVSRIGRRFSDPIWKRDSGQSARLLSAAMPHP